MSIGYWGAWAVAQMLQRGAMIKMDAGCELHGYCSDVTRCWPVSGTFSPPQRALYEAVLEINRRRPLPPARPPSPLPALLFAIPIGIVASIPDLRSSDKLSVSSTSSPHRLLVTAGTPCHRQFVANPALYYIS